MMCVRALSGTTLTFPTGLILLFPYCPVAVRSFLTGGSEI